jgi:hypothetical protein
MLCQEIILTCLALIHHRRRISFNPHVAVQPVLHVNDYKDSEYVICFYEPQDYRRFKKSMHLIVGLLERSNKDTEQVCKVCTRGFERYTEQASSLIRERRNQVYDIVYECQQEKNSPDVMAQLLMSYCSPSQLDAHARGLQDEVQAK